MSFRAKNAKPRAAGGGIPTGVWYALLGLSFTFFAVCLVLFLTGGGKSPGDGGGGFGIAPLGDDDLTPLVGSWLQVQDGIPAEQSRKIVIGKDRTMHYVLPKLDFDTGSLKKIGEVVMGEYKITSVKKNGTQYTLGLEVVEKAGEIRLEDKHQTAIYRLDGDRLSTNGFAGVATYKKVQ